MGEFWGEIEVAADEALRADAGRDEAEATGGKEVWTWLGLDGWRVEGGAGWDADMLKVPRGNGGEERFDMAGRVSWSLSGGPPSAIARGPEQRSLAGGLIWVAET